MLFEINFSVVHKWNAELSLTFLGLDFYFAFRMQTKLVLTKIKNIEVIQKQQ